MALHVEFHETLRALARQQCEQIQSQYDTRGERRVAQHIALANARNHGKSPKVVCASQFTYTEPVRQMSAQLDYGYHQPQNDVAHYGRGAASRHLHSGSFMKGQGWVTATDDRVLRQSFARSAASQAMSMPRGTEESETAQQTDVGSADEDVAGAIMAHLAALSADGGVDNPTRYVNLITRDTNAVRSIQDGAMDTYQQERIIKTVNLLLDDVKDADVQNALMSLSTAVRTHSASPSAPSYSGTHASAGADGDARVAPASGDPTSRQLRASPAPAFASPSVMQTAKRFHTGGNNPMVSPVPSLERMPPTNQPAGAATSVAPDYNVSAAPRGSTPFDLEQLPQYTDYQSQAYPQPNWDQYNTDYQTHMPNWRGLYNTDYQTHILPNMPSAITASHSGRGNPVPQGGVTARDASTFARAREGDMSISMPSTAELARVDARAQAQAASHPHKNETNQSLRHDTEMTTDELAQEHAVRPSVAGYTLGTFNNVASPARGAVTQEPSARTIRRRLASERKRAAQAAELADATAEMETSLAAFMKRKFHEGSRVHKRRTHTGPDTTDTSAAATEKSAAKRARVIDQARLAHARSQHVAVGDTGHDAIGAASAAAARAAAAAAAAAAAVSPKRTRTRAGAASAAAARAAAAAAAAAADRPLRASTPSANIGPGRGVGRAKGRAASRSRSRSRRDM